jgi:hypothetical protein
MVTLSIDPIAEARDTLLGESLIDDPELEVVRDHAVRQSDHHAAKLH